MNKLLSLVIILFLSTNIYSQIDTTSVAFVSYWSVGDSYDFKVTKINQQWKNDSLTRDQKQEMIANFTVIDSTDTSYTINWSYENDLESNYNIPDELTERFSKYRLTEVQYKTSEVGKFLGILNWQEISEIMNNLFDDMIIVFGENDKQKEDAIRLAAQPFKEIFSSKQGIEELVFKELQYFHFLMGIEFDISEPMIYDEELPNMFGGEPIKAKAKLYFEDVDFEESFCVVKQELRIDPKDTKGILNQIFTLMNLTGEEMDEALSSAVFEINDNNTFEFYYDPGIPHRIETNRELLVDIAEEKGKKIEKTIIELIYYE